MLAVVLVSGGRRGMLNTNSKEFGVLLSHLFGDDKAGLSAPAA